MSIDARIRDGMTRIDQELPAVEAHESFAELTALIKHQQRRRYGVAGLAAAAAVVLAVGVVATVQREPKAVEPAPAPDLSGSLVLIDQGARINLFTDGQKVPLPLLGRFPAFSPDGEQLVFGTVESYLGVWDVLIADADGGDRRVLVECSINHQQCGPAAWSPDSTRVAVPVFGIGDQTGMNEVLIVEAATGRVDSRIDLPRGEWFDRPTWSPDGSRILGVHGGLSDARLATVDPSVGASSISDLGSTYALIDSPAWSPDGTSIAFVVGSNQEAWDPELSEPRSLNVIDADGSGERSVASIPLAEGRIFNVDWSDEARWPFLVSVVTSTGQAAGDSGEHYIARVDEAGTVEPVLKADGEVLRGWQVSELQ